MDGAVIHAVRAGDPAPSTDPMQFSDALTFVRTITVQNGSSLTLYFYCDRNPAATPDFVVKPRENKTIPIRSSKVVTVAYNGINSITGNIYIHYTDEILTSSANPLAGEQHGIYVPFYGSLGNTTPTLNTIELPGVAIIGADPESSSIGYYQFGNQLLLSHLYLDGLPAGMYSIIARNTRSGVTAIESPQVYFATNVDRDYAKPIPLWTVNYHDHSGVAANADKIGDNINLFLTTPNGTPVSFIFNLDCWAT